MSKEEQMHNKADVVYERQRKGFDGVVAALKDCSPEERIRILTSIAILFGLGDDIKARLP